MPFESNYDKVVLKKEVLIMTQTLTSVLKRAGATKEQINCLKKANREQLNRLIYPYIEKLAQEINTRGVESDEETAK